MRKEERYRKVWAKRKMEVQKTSQIRVTKGIPNGCIRNMKNRKILFQPWCQIIKTHLSHLKSPCGALSSLTQKIWVRYNFWPWLPKLEFWHLKKILIFLKPYMIQNYWVLSRKPLKEISMSIQDMFSLKLFGSWSILDMAQNTIVDLLSHQK